MDKVLTGGAQGFVYTSDQDRYDECEAAVNSVLQSIKRLARLLKVTLFFINPLYNAYLVVLCREF